MSAPVSKSSPGPSVQWTSHMVSSSLEQLVYDHNALQCPCIMELGDELLPYIKHNFTTAHKSSMHKM